MSKKHARHGSIGEMSSHRRSQRPLHRVLAAIGAFVLGIGTVIGFGTAAQAATPGIDISILDSDGNVVSNTANLDEGTQLTFQMKYKGTELQGGETVTVTLGSDVHISGAVPPGNAAIDSVVDNGNGTVTIKFKNPIPSTVDQGIYSMNFTLGPVTTDTPSGVSWKYPGEESGVTFVIKDKVTPPTNVTDKYTKAVSPTDLDSLVEVELDPANSNYYKFKGLKQPAATDAELTYTIVLDSKDARTNYPISDTLAAGLGYVSNSFTATIVTYNPTTPSTSFPFTPTVTDGAAGATSSFTGTLASVPADSHIVIQYKAKIRDTAFIENLLRTEFNSRATAGGGHFTGNFSITQDNSAKFGTDGPTATASVRFQGNAPGTCPSCTGVFDKSASWSHLQVDADENGVLTPPAAIDYTFKANLGYWDRRNPDWELNSNVVIDDTLPSQASWSSSASDFIVASASAGASAFPLTSMTCPTTRADFALDANVGKYCVDGKTLWVNVGKDHTRGTITVTAKAVVNNITGLTEAPSQTNIVDAKAYTLKNDAKFTSNGSTETTKSVTSYPIVLPKDRDGGLNDSDVFTKAANNDVVVVEPDEPATVNYTFTVDTAKGGIDPLNSKIVDYVNTAVFDISNLASINVTGKYGSTNLGASDFALSTNTDGNLEIALSTQGKNKVTLEGVGKVWNVYLPLTTHVLKGKTTFEITNKATLFGQNGTADYWSDDHSEATSYGDEAEVRKRLFDGAGDWTDNVNAEVDADGNLINDTFVYRVQFIPRGNYDNVVIFDVVDTLPAGTTFLGFVDASDTAGASPSMATRDIGGNIEASYASGVVTLKQKAGTRLNANAGEIAAYFAVKLENAKKPVVNKIGNTEAIITPFGAPSIDIEKWTDEGATPLYDQDGKLTNDGYAGDFDSAKGKKLEVGKDQLIHFTISNDGLEDLVNVKVGDSRTGGVGDVQNVVCTFPDDSTGLTWAGPFLKGTQFSCTGTLPGLQAGQSHSDTATVTGVGIISGTEVDDADEWHGYTEPDLMADTGARFQGWLIASGAGLLLAGGALMLVRRSNRKA